MSGFRRYLPLLHALLAIGLFAVAAAALRNSLSNYRWQDFVAYTGSLPKAHVALAIAMTFAGYLVMTGYDAFALHYIERTLRYWRVALASFCGYAINNNIGLSGVVGMSLRYRLYSGWGLTAGEIARVLVFCTLTYWLGFAVLGGLVFLIQPPPMPPGFAIPFSSIRLLGAALLLPAALYLVSLLVYREPVRFRRFRVEMPKPSLFLIQVAVSMADWVLASAVLYVLLPSRPQPFPHILAIFLLAQIAGLVSNVPGGIGVFEAVALLFLKPHFDLPAILGALIAFRGIYYLLPLGVALLLLTSHAGARRILR